MSPVRKETVMFLDHWRYNIPTEEVKRVLDIGVAGDPEPGGHFGNSNLFKDAEYLTADVDPQYKTDYTFDIAGYTFPLEIAETIDCLILSNTIEHIYDFRRAIQNSYTLLRPGGYFIVDSPWIIPYHAEDNFEDYWRISAKAFEAVLRDCGFVEIQTKQGVYTSSAMARRPWGEVGESGESQ